MISPVSTSSINCGLVGKDVVQRLHMSRCCGCDVGFLILCRFVVQLVYLLWTFNFLLICPRACCTANRTKCDPGYSACVLTDFEAGVSELVSASSCAPLPDVLPSVTEDIASWAQFRSPHDATVTAVQAVLPARQTQILSTSDLRHSADETAYTTNDSYTRLLSITQVNF